MILKVFLKSCYCELYQASENSPIKQAEGKTEASENENNGDNPNDGRSVSNNGLPNDGPTPPGDGQFSDKYHGYHPAPFSTQAQIPFNNRVQGTLGFN